MGPGHAGHAGYKRDDRAAVLARHALLRGLGSEGDGDHDDAQFGLVLDDALMAAVEHPACGDDVVDALLAGLVAAATCTPGGTVSPPAPDTPDGQLAALEGWIAVPTGPLARIAPVP